MHVLKIILGLCFLGAVAVGGGYAIDKYYAPLFQSIERGNTPPPEGLRIEKGPETSSNLPSAKE